MGVFKLTADGRQCMIPQAAAETAADTLKRRIENMKRATYNGMREELAHIIGDVRILSGEIVGPSDATWQDVAGTLAVNLRCLAAMLEEWRKGNAEPFCSFPGLDDVGVDARG